MTWTEVTTTLMVEVGKAMLGAALTLGLAWLFADRWSDSLRKRRALKEWAQIERQCRNAARISLAPVFIAAISRGVPFPETEPFRAISERFRLLTLRTENLARIRHGQINNENTQAFLVLDTIRKRSLRRVFARLTDALALFGHTLPDDFRMAIADAYFVIQEALDQVQPIDHSLDDETFEINLRVNAHLGAELFEALDRLWAAIER